MSRTRARSAPPTAPPIPKKRSADVIRSAALELTRGLRGRIALAIGLGVLGSGFGIARIVLLGMLLAGVFTGAEPSYLVSCAVGVAVAVLLRAMLDHARTVIAHSNAIRVQEELRGRLYDKIAELGPAGSPVSAPAASCCRWSTASSSCRAFFGQFVPQASVAALTPIAIFAVIAWWDAPVAAVMLVAALVTLIAPTAWNKIEGRKSRARQQAMKSFGSEFLDAVQGLPTLKAFGQSTAYGRRLAERARLLSDTTMRVLSTSVMTRGITDAGIAIGASAALALGVWRVSNGSMTIEALLIVLMAGTEVFRPLRDLRSVLHQGMVGQAAAAGIHALLEAEPLVPATSGVRLVGTTSLRPTIEFDDVHFAYPGGRGAAHDGLSFAVAAGEKIGIVGPSGSGKSSVARLLLRLFDPQSGAVRVGGQDVRTLDPEMLRRQIAVVHQDTYLFSRHGRGEFAPRQTRGDAIRTRSGGA